MDCQKRTGKIVFSGTNKVLVFSFVFLSAICIFESICIHFVNKNHCGSKCPVTSEIKSLKLKTNKFAYMRWDFLTSWTSNKRLEIIS
jgi:hypothetical protein